jgi:hypothetical protein
VIQGEGLLILPQKSGKREQHIHPIPNPENQQNNDQSDFIFSLTFLYLSLNTHVPQ